MFFQLWALIGLIPLVLSLNITLDTPIGSLNTSISLCWAHDDPSDFVLGAFLIHTTESVMVAKTTQPVEIFAADRTAYMTFNYTSLPGNRDCILLAWLPDARPGHHFAQSEVFSVMDSGVTTSKPTSSSIPSILSVSGAADSRLETTPTERIVMDTPSPESAALKSTFSDVPSSPTSTVRSNASPDPASHTGIIVGVVFSVLTLGCVVSAVYLLTRRRRSKAVTPFLCPQDSTTPTLTPFPLKSSLRDFHQERETEAQEPVSEVLRDHLEAENARMREEIMVLQLENQIRQMEAGYGSLPPSYRSASSISSSNVSNSADLSMYDLRVDITDRAR